jgi:hypothetical protein
LQRAGALVLGLLSLLVFPGNLRAEDAPRSHANLDWEAPYRWVHVDNLDPAKAGRFESARKSWLEALRKDDALLGDGRPLFWHARASKAGQTFFTFYPFRTWADLDARRLMIDRTQKELGEKAVKEYDRGDVALVSPHYSQVWRREPDYDIASEAAKDLTERTAMAGRLEVHGMDVRRSEDVDRAWKRIANALASSGYPLACRAFSSTYGRGEVMLFWLAKDDDAYRAARPLRAEMERQFGKKEAEKLANALQQNFPLQESYEVERRPDLSNLGK